MRYGVTGKAPIRNGTLSSRNPVGSSSTPAAEKYSAAATILTPSSDVDGYPWVNLTDKAVMVKVWVGYHHAGQRGVNRRPDREPVAAGTTSSHPAHSGFPTSSTIRLPLDSNSTQLPPDLIGAPVDLDVEPTVE